MRYIFILLFFPIILISATNCPKGVVSVKNVDTGSTDWYNIPDIVYSSIRVYEDYGNLGWHRKSNTSPVCNYSVYSSSRMNAYPSLNATPVTDPCPDGDWNVTTQTCNLPPNPCDGFNPPSEYNGQPYINTFFEDVECTSYMLDNLVSPAYCVPSSSLGAPDGCVRIVGYGNQQDPCEGVIPPTTYKNLPFQGKYPSDLFCTEAVRQFSVDGIGECISTGKCPLFYAYFRRYDGSFPPPSDSNNSRDLPNGPDIDNSSPTPGRTDDNNDSIDLNPLLGQIGDASDRNHNDNERLLGRVDNGFSQLHSDLEDLKSLSSSQNNILLNSSTNVNVDMSGVENRLDTLNNLLNPDNLPSIPDDPQQSFFENITNDLQTVSTTYENAKSVISNGFDPDSLVLPTGSDPVFETQFHGKTLKLDLCQSFAVIRPLVTFFITLLFYVMSIRIFIFAIRIM